MSRVEQYLPEGLPAPARQPDGLDQSFWDGTARGHLVVQRCTKCKTWQWGPEWICHRCHSFEMGWEAVDPRGVVHSWTRVWHLVHPALKGHGPYILVLVELPQAGGVRLLGNLLGDPEQEVKVGAAVEAVFEPHRGPSGTYNLVQWQQAHR